MESLEKDSLMNVEEENFFDLLDEEKDSEIIKLLTPEIPIEIWKYRNKDNENSTVLHVSVYKNNYKITKFLLDYIKRNNKNELNDFINFQNSSGVTALHYASFRGNVCIIKLLIDFGANESIKTNRNLNIIHYCAQGNNPNSLIYFYFRFKEKDKNENTHLLDFMKAEDQGGSTPLHWAVYSCAEDILLYLLNLDIFENSNEKQQFIDKKDGRGYTALHLCSISKSSRIALKLLQNGASTNIEDNNKKTAYKLAKEKGQDEIAKIIGNSMGCQFCKITAPTKQIKKSKKNMILIFIFQLIEIIIMFISTIPFGNYPDLTGKILSYTYIALLILFIIIYILLLMINPGVKKRRSLSDLCGLIENNEDLKKYCYKCFVKKEKDLKHCIICNECYKDFDHHCYWINKCVAKNNYILFIFFLIETFLLLAIILCCCIFAIIRYIQKDHEIKMDLINLYSIKFINDFFKNNEIIHLILNILLLIIDLFFIIPEGLLVILHLNICCGEIKEKRKNKKNKENNDNEDSDLASINSIDNKQSLLPNN